MPSTPGTIGPLDAGCRCLTCSRWSRGYLRHLLGVGEPTAWRLVSIHNLAFVLDLMAEARAAIAEQRFDALRASVAEVWGPAALAASLGGGAGLQSDRCADP